MSAPITVENVVKAVDALYNTNDASSKEAASIWLQEFQNSVEAWTISDQLLHLKIDLNTCYFAAHTMRGKIQHKFLEVPVDFHDSLKVSLMNHVGQITVETPHSISTQLCLALADLCCQMANWKKAVSEIIRKFQESMEISGHLIVLDVLALLPEEVENYSLRLGQNRRNELRGELEDQSGLVLAYLQECLTSLNRFGSNQSRVLQLIFKAYASWWKSDLWHESDVINASLNEAIFTVLKSLEHNAETQEAATDCLVAMFSSVKHNGLDLFERLVQVIQPKVIALDEDYRTVVALDNVDRCLNFCRIFTEMAEAVLPRMIAFVMNTQETQDCCQLLINCMGHYSREICDVTLNFWSLLFDGMRNSHRYRGLFEPYNSENFLPTGFLPYISLLLQALVRHCQLEPTELTYGDELKDFRSSVGDLIKELMAVLPKKQQFVQEVCQWLTLPDWRAVEASLFILRYLIHGSRLDEAFCHDLAQLINAQMARFPEEPRQLMITCLSLFGEIGVQDKQEHLGGYITFALSRLEVPGLANGSLCALSRLLTYATKETLSADRLHATVLVKLPLLSVKATVAEHLYEQIALVYRAPTRTEEAKAFSMFCGVCLAELDKMVKSPTEVRLRNGCAKTDPAYWLDCISALFRNMDHIRAEEEEPANSCEMLPVIEIIWPHLLMVMERYLPKVHVMERATRTVRFFFRALKMQMRPLLEIIANKLVDLYYRSQHSCLLYLGGIMVDTFGTDESTHPGLLEMFMAYLKPTCTLLEGEGLQQNPGTVEDLFRLCTRMVQCCGRVTGQNRLLMQQMVLIALRACELRQNDALDATTFFLKVVFKQSDQEQEVHATMRHLIIEVSDAESLGFLTVNKIMHTICNGFPSSLLKDLSIVFDHLIILDRPRFERWMEHTLTQLPLVRSDGYVQVTQAQLQDFQKVFLNDPPGSKQICEAMKRFGRLFR